MKRSFLSSLDVAAHTDIGPKRARNEDTISTMIPAEGSAEHPLGAAFIVADGMGGLGAGDVASQTAVAEFTRRYFSTSTVETDLLQRFKLALESASARVRDQAARLGLPHIGSAAAGMLIQPSGTLLLFNVGDCRVYRVRHRKIERMTRDQSVTEKQLALGRITPEEARQARSSQVTAFIGQPMPLHAYVEMDQGEQGDIYILCSDGLWGTIDAATMQAVVQHRSARAAAQALVSLALARGTRDNVSVVVIRVGKAAALPRMVRRVALAALGALLGVGVYALLSVLPTATVAPSPTDAQFAVPTIATPQVQTSSDAAPFAAQAEAQPTPDVGLTPTLPVPDRSWF
jgi:protein phosphatase